MKHSTAIEKQTKKTNNYNEGFSWRLKPISPEAIEREAEEMIEYFKKNTKKITLVSYSNFRNIHVDTLNKWCKKHKVLREAYEYCRQMLWERREEGMAYGVLKEKPVMRNMHHYSKQWKADNAYWSELNQKEEVQPTKLVVEMPSFKEK